MSIEFDITQARIRAFDTHSPLVGSPPADPRRVQLIALFDMSDERGQAHHLGDACCRRQTSPTERIMKMVSKNKGKPRAQVEAESLMHRNQLLAFIQANGKVETEALIEATGCTRSTIRLWLLGMVESGHVNMSQTGGGEGRFRNIWSAGANKAPLEKFNSDFADFLRKDPVIRRSFVKAKQIGMVRDSLVAALFGPAVRA